MQNWDRRIINQIYYHYPGAFQSCQKRCPGQSLCGPSVSSRSHQFHSPRSAQTNTTCVVHSQSLPVFSHNHSFTQPQTGTHPGSLSYLLPYGISIPCFSRPLDDFQCSLIITASHSPRLAHTMVTLQSPTIWDFNTLFFQTIRRLTIYTHSSCATTGNRAMYTNLKHVTLPPCKVWIPFNVRLPLNMIPTCRYNFQLCQCGLENKSRSLNCFNG